MRLEKQICRQEMLGLELDDTQIREAFQIFIYSLQNDAPFISIFVYCYADTASKRIRSI